VSDADDDEEGAEEDEFFEQAEMTGSANSASAAMVATVVPRGRALTIEPGAVKIFKKVDFSDVMAWSLESATASPIGCGGQSRNMGADGSGLQWPNGGGF
jgi:hypothetical protein